MKPFLKTLERVFVYYFTSVGISLLANILLSIPLRFVFWNHIALTNFSVGVLSMLISLFFLFYRDGKKTKKVELKLFLPSLVVVLVLIVLITLIIGQAVYVLGPTELLDGFLPKSFVKSPINPKVSFDVYSFASGVAAFLLLYSPIMLISEYVGTKKAR